MKSIDLIAYKIEAYDSDDFIKDLSNSNITYVIFLYNPLSGYSIVSNVFKSDKKKTMLPTALIHKFNWITYVILFPIAFIIDFIMVSIKVNQIVKKYSPENAFVDNTYIAIHFAKLRKKAKIQNFIYASHDWLGDNEKNLSFSNFFKYCFSKFFIKCDSYACKRADIVLHHTENVKNKRTSYWKENIIKGEEFLYKPNFSPLSSILDKSESSINSNALIFLGRVTNFSGLDLVLNSIAETKYKLNVVGATNTLLSSLIKANDKADFEYLGYLDRDKIYEIVSRSVIGLNLITSNNSHTIHTIPSKVIDYLRCGIPVVVTKDIGSFSDVVTEYNIGIVISANNEEIIKAFNQIRTNHNLYRDNIAKFFTEYPFSNILDYLKLEHNAANKDLNK